MDISVIFDYENCRWTISPDPAIVTVGTPITWFVRGQGLTSLGIKWTIFFEHGMPFTETPFLDTVTATDEERGSHVGSIGPATPTEPGDYKYGVKAEDTTTKKLLGDDDPRLIVRP